MDFINPNMQSFEHEGNTVRFRTITRGDTSSIRLKLSDVGSDAALTFQFEEAIETGSAPPFYRTHRTIPATQLQLRLADLEDAKLSRKMPAENYPNDSITLRRVVTDGIRQVNFNFTDTKNPNQGDYYYFKVEQANDAIAWTSPIWVGGYPSL